MEENVYKVPCDPQLRDDILTLKLFMQSSLEYLHAEEKSFPQRLQSQTLIAANLVAEQDVALSPQVATDSKEIVAASRRDGAVLRIIARIGALFLPGTFTAVRSNASSKDQPNAYCPRLFWP